MKCKMEHSHTSSGESWYSSVFLQVAFKICSRKDQVLHTTLWYGTSAWRCCDFCCCSYTSEFQNYGLSALPLISSPQPYFIKESHSWPSSAGKWNGKSLYQKEWGKKKDRIFWIPPCPISHCFLIIPISYLNSPVYTSSSSMDTHSICLGKIWNRFYINK